jgi:hypothetical protein
MSIRRDGAQPEGIAPPDCTSDASSGRITSRQESRQANWTPADFESHHDSIVLHDLHEMQGIPVDICPSVERCQVGQTDLKLKIRLLQ